MSPLRLLGSVVLYALCSLLLAVGIALAVRHFAFQAFRVPSSAMKPTLQVGDHFVANKYVYRFQEPKRGEVIVFKYPEDQSIDFVKRIIAVGGETVEIRNKQVFIDGKPLYDPWGVHVDTNTFTPGKDANSVRDHMNPVLVPPGSYFTLGDNRDASHDSRYWGFVKREAVKGKAQTIYLSIDDKSKKIRLERIGMAIR